MATTTSQSRTEQKLGTQFPLWKKEKRRQKEKGGSAELRMITKSIAIRTNYYAEGNDIRSTN